MNNKKDKFREIYEENFDSIYGFVYLRLAGRTSNVEDIVQEIFFAAARGFEKFEGKSAVKTWIYGIAKHKIADYYRQEIPKNKLLQNDIFSYKTNPERSAMSKENGTEESVTWNPEKEKVLDVLDKLLPVYRYSLLLKYIDGYSIKEIAKILKRTPKAVDGILQRAKIEFKKNY
ncbi:MAG: RNA polymerase sigma factor [Actinobacteria bacterium]|nr:RNA polymerase sigma factor [Actinomycetota bacterium]